MRWRVSLMSMLAACLCTVPCVGESVVFFEDFDGGDWMAPDVTGEISGPSGSSRLSGVQGYAGYGTGTNQFSGRFLHNWAQRGPDGNAPGTVLRLDGLPEHTHISLGFLLAIIDSWDGSTSSGNPRFAPDYFNIELDGTLIFRETFDNHPDPRYNDQSYVAPPGVTVVDRQEMGFSGDNFPGVFVDSGYDMGLDPQFQLIQHTSSSLEVRWFASGRGWQGNGPPGGTWSGGEWEDESFALDNIQVGLHNFNVIPEPSTLALVGLGLPLVWIVRRHRRIG